MTNGSSAVRIVPRALAVLALGLLPSLALAGAAESAPTTCRGEAVTMTGTRGADVLRGTAGQDSIVALGGNDVIRGMGSRDEICAGRGDDRLVGVPVRTASTAPPAPTC